MAEKLIIVSIGAVEEVGDAIVRALVGATNYRGRPFVLTTIDPELLQRVALAALQMASGATIWQLGDPPLEILPDETLPWLKKIYPR